MFNSFLQVNDKYSHAESFVKQKTGAGRKRTLHINYVKKRLTRGSQ